MSKVGLCTLVVEPHVFETTVFTVREAQPQIDSIIRQPESLQEISVPQTVSHVQQPAAPIPSEADISLALRQDSITNSLSDMALQRSSVIYPPLSHSDSQAQPPGPRESPKQKLPVTPQHSRTGSRSQEHTTPTQTSQDPVIHMLAQRAVSDPSLRSLMKRVAIGEATQSELKIFQNHIEELKAQQRAKRMAQRPLAPSHVGSSASSSSSSVQPSTVYGHGRSLLPDHPTSAPVMPRVPPPHPSALPEQIIKIENPPRPQLQSSTTASKSNVNHFKGEIIAVALEFSAGSGDRFLFPKYSILEYNVGRTEVIASFLVLRDGITAQDHSYIPTKEYYQPVTIRMSAHHPRVLDPLEQIVASPEEVRDHMNKVMDHAHRWECNPLLIKPLRSESNDSREDLDIDDQAFEQTRQGLSDHRGYPRKRQIRM